MIDVHRLIRRLMHWSVAGYPVVRIWLGTGDYQRLCEAAGPTGPRLCGVPITVTDVAPSRVVFQDGTAVPWERVI